MTDTQARLILIVGCLGVLPFGLYHRLKSQTDERLDRSLEGWPILLTLRPLAAICVMGLFAFVLHPPWMAWAAVPVSDGARWLGVLFGLLGATVVVATFRALGSNLTDTVVTRRDAQLVTRGPYRWVRHPFYVAFALFILTATFLTANWFIGLTGAAAFVAIVLRTRIEERYLIERFGDSYTRYMKTTGRFFPRLFG